MSDHTKSKNAAIMKLQATYCNNIEFNLSKMGLRLTFGEQSLMAGEPPVHRVAVFIPISMLDSLVDTMVKVRADAKAKEQAPKSALQN
jgi:hypothetical protein